MTILEESSEIVFNRSLTPDTWLMALASPGIAGSAKPGQFVMLQVHSGNDPLLRRPFSICGTGEGALFILYRVVGKGTAMMSRKKAGGTMSLLGPLGRGFEKMGDDAFALLVAGGIGIAPLLFLARTMDPAHYRLLAGFRTAREIIRAGDVVGNVGDIGLATDDGSAGHAGPVTDLLAGYLDGDGAGDSEPGLFACGPLPMLRKVVMMARQSKTPCQVSLEASMACGLGACQGCAVKADPGEGHTYYHVCKDGPVFPSSAIDWEST